MIPQLPSVIIHVEAFSPTTSPPVFANLSTDKMCFTKTKAFKGRGYNLKRSIVEAGWRWRGGFLQKDFKVLTFAHCIRYFLSLAWKWTCQFYCALKEIFFLGTFCRRMLWDAAEGHSQDKKDSKVLGNHQQIRFQSRTLSRPFGFYVNCSLQISGTWRKTNCWLDANHFSC